MAVPVAALLIVKVEGAKELQTLGLRLLQLLVIHNTSLVGHFHGLIGTLLSAITSEMGAPRNQFTEKSSELKA